MIGSGQHLRIFLPWGMMYAKIQGRISCSRRRPSKPIFCKKDTI